MKIPGYQPGPIDYWLAEAATQFINGAIGGIKLGGLIGGGTGATTAFSPLGEGLPPLKQVLFSLLGFVVTMFANGVSRFSTWHDTHPVPNPMPAPAEDKPVV